MTRSWGSSGQPCTSKVFRSRAPPWQPHRCLWPLLERCSAKDMPRHMELTALRREEVMAGAIRAVLHPQASCQCRGHPAGGFSAAEQGQGWALHEAWGHAVPRSHPTPTISLVRAGCSASPHLGGLSGLLSPFHPLCPSLHSATTEAGKEGNTPHFCWSLAAVVAVQ